MFAIRLAVVLIAAVAGAQDLTLDQILAKNTEALGGAQALKAIQTVTMNAKMVMGGVMEMPMLMQMKRPGKVRSEMSLQGRKMTSAYDGTTGWMINPLQSAEPQKMDERMLKSVQNSAEMDSWSGSLEGMKESGHTVELQGKEDVEGSTAFKIKVTLKDGDVRTYFLDVEKFLAVKVILKMAQFGREMEVETFPGNYKKVGGVLIAHSSESKVNGKPVAQMTVEKIEFNLPIDDSIFQMPAVQKPEEKKQ